MAESSQPEASRDHRITNKVSLIAGVAALLLAPLLMGGVHLPVRVLLALLLFVALVATLSSAWREGRRLYLGPAGWGLSLLLGWTFLQWLPLPFSMVELLAPGSAETRATAAELLGVEAPSWISISMDASRTADAWIALLAYWLIYVVVTNEGAGSWRRQAPLLVVLVASLLVMLTGILHTLFGPGIFLGFHPPATIRSEAFFQTILVNPNHGAAIMLLGVGAAMALWWGVRTKPVRWLAIAAAVSLALATVATGARACTLLLLPVVLGGALAGSHALLDPDARRHLLVTSLGVVAATVVLVFLTVSDVWLEEWRLLMDPGNFLESAFRQRWVVGWSTAMEHLLVGAGHGAFEVASPIHSVPWASGWMAYAHNIVLQFISDWGVLVGSMGMGLLLWAVIRALWTLRSNPSAVVIGITLTSLLLENLVDFSLHMPGLGLLAMACLAWLTQESRQEAPPASVSIWERWTLSPSPTVVLVLGGALALTIWHARTQNPERWDARSRAQLEEPQVERVSLEEMLMEHPSDFHLFAVASALAWEVGDKERAWRLMDRAVDLAPAYPGNLLARARLHRAAGDAQAAIPDLKEMGKTAGNRLRVVRELLQWPEGDQVLQEVMKGNEEFILAAVTEFRIRSTPAKITSILEWGRRELPESVAIAEALAEQYLWTPGRTRELDRMATQILAEGVETENPELSAQRKRTGYLLQGFVHKRDKKLLEAYHLFREAALLAPSEAVYPLLLAGGVAESSGDLVRLERILSELRVHRIADPRYRSSFHHLVSRRHELEGHVRQAIEQMHRAVLFQPKIARHHARLADLYERLGHTEAVANHRQQYEGLTGQVDSP